MGENIQFSGTVTESSEKDNRMAITIDGKKYGCFDKLKETAQEILTKTKEVHGTFYENVKDGRTYRNISKIEPGLVTVEEIEDAKDTPQNEALAKKIEARVNTPSPPITNEINGAEFGLCAKLAVRSMHNFEFDSDKESACWIEYKHRVRMFFGLNQLIKKELEQGK